MKIETYSCDLCGNYMVESTFDVYDRTTDVVSEYRCDTTEGKKISGKVTLVTNVRFKDGVDSRDVCQACLLKMMHKAKEM